MQRPKVPWCTLPIELWQIIGEHLQTRVDVLRFRSVCSLWRSALPPLLLSSSPPLLPQLLRASRRRLPNHSLRLCDFGGHKHLVECEGDLYVVDRYFGNEGSTPPRIFNGQVVDFKVYRLDDELKAWVNVTNLGDKVIVLSYDGSFAVSASEFAGVKGNCIMFTDQDFGLAPAAIGMGSRSRHCRVFDLGDGTMSNVGDSQLFRVPSNWLTH